MKEKMGQVGFVALGILFCLLLVAYAYFNNDNTQENTRISVILNSGSSGQWEALQQGIDSFAKEKNVEVNYVMLEGTEDVQTQAELLHRELANGAEGILLNLPNKAELLGEIDVALVDTNVRVVTVDSSLPLTADVTLVSSDNYAMGGDLAKVALQDAAGQGDVLFGIVTGSTDMQANAERLRGVEEILGERIAFESESSAGIAQKDWKQTDHILCLDARVGEEILELAKEEGKKLYVIGRTEQLVYNLDKGYVDALLVTDEFVVGYTALQTLYQQIRLYQESDDKEVPYIIVNRANLYQPENERIMFPVIQ